MQRSAGMMTGPEGARTHQRVRTREQRRTHMQPQGATLDSRQGRQTGPKPQSTAPHHSHTPPAAAPPFAAGAVADRATRYNL